jgi:hypothetical protein
MLRTRTTLGSLATESREDDSRDVLCLTLDSEACLAHALLNCVCNASTRGVGHLGE